MEVDGNVARESPVDGARASNDGRTGQAWECGELWWARAIGCPSSHAEVPGARGSATGAEDFKEGTSSVTIDEADLASNIPKATFGQNLYEVQY